jgi:CheY-like chemotaxis protein
LWISGNISFTFMVILQEIILMVDDEATDGGLVRIAVEKMDKRFRVEVVTDGEEAIKYLVGDGGFGDRKKFPIPMLILLDLRMPGMDGVEFLEWLRRDGRFTFIPVVVLSGAVPLDAGRASQLGVRACLQKQVDFCVLVSELRSVLLEWVPMIPPGPGPHRFGTDSTLD